MNRTRRCLDLVLVSTAIATALVAAACAGDSPIDVTKGGSGGPPATFAAGAFVALQTENCGQSTACHSQAGPQDGLALPDAAGVLAAPLAYISITTGGLEGPAVVPGDADASLLIRKGRGELTHTGGPVWENGDDTYDTVESWIDAGALNN